MLVSGRFTDGRPRLLLKSDMGDSTAERAKCVLSERPIGVCYQRLSLLAAA